MDGISEIWKEMSSKFTKVRDKVLKPYRGKAKKFKRKRRDSYESESNSWSLEEEDDDGEMDDFIVRDDDDHAVEDDEYEESSDSEKLSSPNDCPGCGSISSFYNGECDNECGYKGKEEDESSSSSVLNLDSDSDEFSVVEEDQDVLKDAVKDSNPDVVDVGGFLPSARALRMGITNYETYISTLPENELELFLMERYATIDEIKDGQFVVKDGEDGEGGKNEKYCKGQPWYYKNILKAFKKLAINILSPFYIFLEFTFSHIEEKPCAPVKDRSCPCNILTKRSFEIHLRNRFTGQTIWVGTTCINWCGVFLKRIIKVAVILRNWKVNRWLGWEYPDGPGGRRGRYMIGVGPNAKIVKHHDLLKRYFGEDFPLKKNDQGKWVMYITAPRSIQTREQKHVRILLTATDGVPKLKFHSFVSQSDIDNQKRLEKEDAERRAAGPKRRLKRAKH